MTLRARGEEPQLAFAKTGDKWGMTAPVTAAVESWQVDSVAMMLKDLSYKEKYVPEATGPRSLDATGLAKPRFSIKFEDSGKHQYTLLMGKRTPAGASYAQVAGDPSKTIYVLDSNPVERLDKDPSEFRSKDLADVAAEKATGVTVTQPRQKVVLAKSGGKWIMTRRWPRGQSATAVEDLLTQFQAIESGSVCNADADRCGLRVAAADLERNRDGDGSPPHHPPTGYDRTFCDGTGQRAGEDESDHD